MKPDPYATVKMLLADAATIEKALDAFSDVEAPARCNYVLAMICMTVLEDLGMDARVKLSPIETHLLLKWREGPLSFLERDDVLVSTRKDGPALVRDNDANETTIHTRALLADLRLRVAELRE